MKFLQGKNHPAAGADNIHISLCKTCREWIIFVPTAPKMILICLVMDFNFENIILLAGQWIFYIGTTFCLPQGTEILTHGQKYQF